jgi:hypothetical protein
MKTYLKQAAFVLAVVAAAKFAKDKLPVPDAVKALLP